MKIHKIFFNESFPKFLEVSRELGIKGLQCKKFENEGELKNFPQNACCSKKYSVNDNKEDTCNADTKFMSNSTEINQGKNMSQEQNCKSLKSPVPRKQKQETSNYKKYFPQIPRSKMEGRPGNLIPLRKISQKSLKEEIWQCNLCRRRFSSKPEAVIHFQEAHKIAKGSIYFKNITKVI